MPAHLAAISIAKGEPFSLQTRETPKPGPGELLIAVKSIALNPADGLIRNLGLFIPSYPTVIGFDIAGLVIEVGERVPTRQNGGEDKTPCFEPGITRVAAYAASYWRSYDANYGAFQERCLVPWQHAMPIEDERISWNQAATLPVSIQVPLSAWDAMGIPRLKDDVEGKATQSKTQSENEKEALLVWGASSSVGTMGVQSARLLCDDHTSSFKAVYATAGVENHEYVSSLGADRVFDYKDPYVMDTIVAAAHQDGLLIRNCFLATGQLSACQAVLKAFLELDKKEEQMSVKIASAPIVPVDAENLDGIEVMFIQPSSEEKGRLEQFEYWLGEWGRRKLAKGLIRPSPEPKVIGKGLEAVNGGLDTLLQGVSGMKLVVEVEE